MKKLLFHNWFPVFVLFTVTILISYVYFIGIPVKSGVSGCFYVKSIESLVAEHKFIKKEDLLSIIQEIQKIKGSSIRGIKKIYLRTKDSIMVETVDSCNGANATGRYYLVEFKESKLEVKDMHKRWVAMP